MMHVQSIRSITSLRQGKIRHGNAYRFFCSSVLCAYAPIQYARKYTPTQHTHTHYHKRTYSHPMCTAPSSRRNLIRNNWKTHQFRSQMNGTDILLKLKIVATETSNSRATNELLQLMVHMHWARAPHSVMSLDFFFCCYAVPFMDYCLPKRYNIESALEMMALVVVVLCICDACSVRVQLARENGKSCANITIFIIHVSGDRACKIQIFAGHRSVCVCLRWTAGGPPKR